MSKCLSFSGDLIGTHPTPFYDGDFLLANLVGKPVLVKRNPELDDFGNIIGEVVGLALQTSVAIAHEKLYRAFGIEYMVYQNGPIAADFHDKTGMQRGTVIGPFEGPQGVRRFLSTYHPDGIGFINLFGPPIGVEEGFVVRICPLGEPLGDNPLWASERLASALQSSARK